MSDDQCNLMFKQVNFTHKMLAINLKKIVWNDSLHANRSGSRGQLQHSLVVHPPPPPPGLKVIADRYTYDSGL